MQRLLKSPDNGDSYHKELSRGGLKVASTALQEYVALAFAILDTSEDLIHKNNAPSQKAGLHILTKLIPNDEFGFSCTGHESSMCMKFARIVTNVFFNNKRKCATEAVVDDRIVAFKKSKRTKQ